jgi:hypothetical protein
MQWFGTQRSADGDNSNSFDARAAAADLPDPCYVALS